MNINNHVKNNIIKLKVIPNSSRNELVEENHKLKLYVKAPPEKDKANNELIKFFKKKLHLTVEIKSGKRSREKIVTINH